MGAQYDQLTASERAVIGRLHASGRSRREIARTLARSASTISREIRRNSRPTKRWTGGYEAGRAQALSERRHNRGRTHKLARQPDLRDLVRDRLAMGWSPEQIAGRLALEHGATVISHESIYRYVYFRSAQKDYWHRLLPRAKHRRGRLGQRGGSPVDRIKARYIEYMIRDAVEEDEGGAIFNSILPKEQTVEDAAANPPPSKLSTAERHALCHAPRTRQSAPA